MWNWFKSICVKRNPIFFLPYKVFNMGKDTLHRSVTNLIFVPGGLFLYFWVQTYGWDFQNTPHSYSQYFWKPYPFIYFRWKSWLNHIFHNNIVTCFFISINLKVLSLCTYFFWSLVGPNWQIKYSILFYIVAACAKLEDEFQRHIYHPLI
jgi:hypothetical protein